MRTRSLSYAACAAFIALACAKEASREETFTSDRVSVVTRGSGPDVILVPGLAAHRDVWNIVADSLDDRYRLHVVQVNGFAGVPAGANANGPVSAPVAEEIARYIREARLDRPAIVGHSMGGTIGLMVAARHPDLVGRLMVVDMIPFMGVMFGPNVTTADSARPIADRLKSQMTATKAGSADDPLGQMVMTMTRNDAMKPTLGQYARTSDRATVANAFHELIVTDLRPELALIRAPLTLLYVKPANAPGSPEDFDKSVRMLWANAPSARLVRIDDSNHYIQIDQPARVVAEVDALMRR